MFVKIDFLTLAHFGQTASDTDTSFFFLHEFSMSKRSSVLIFALYIRLKSLSKYLWRRKLQRYAFFFFTVKTVLSTVDKNEDKTMPASFQVQEFLYVQSIV